MNRRRKTSGGQALVLVTLGLMAMFSMMGLAVDLGWSFFVEKQAQAAADFAAMGAVQEALVRLNGQSFGFTCPTSPSGSLPVYCQPTQVDCVSGTIPGGINSNLWNGCLYGQQNGFTSGGLAARQRVTIQSNESDALNPPPTDMCVQQMKCVKDAVYWVTVRTTQTIPQLFSAIMGHTEGIVSTKATAALVSVVVPASFIALNEAGDCISKPNSPGQGFVYDCGTDVDLQGGGKAVCQNSGGQIAALCGGQGILLSSTCHGLSNQAGCKGSNGTACDGSGSFAGCTQGTQSNVWGLSIQIQRDAQNSGSVDDPSQWTPTPALTSDASLFQDPLHKLSQPPIAASTSNTQIAQCGIPGGTITGSNDPANPLVLGPYQYFSTTSNVNLTPTGAPIVLNGAVKFDAGGACSNNYFSSTATSFPGAGALNSQFGTYLFYGGLKMMTNDTFTFGPGQYVMVGTNSTSGSAFTLGSGGNPHVVGSTAGAQFITTAPTVAGGGSYPGLDYQMAASSLASLASGAVPLYQGSTDIGTGSSGSADLYGLNRNNLFGMAPEIERLGNYSGNLFWQDRRNSTVVINTNNGEVASRPCFPDGCATLPTALSNNRVTFTSPAFNYTSNASLNLHGAVYQPRGGWLRVGGSAQTQARIQIVTGMILKDGGGQLDLQPTDAPLVKFIDTLIE